MPKANLRPFKIGDSVKNRDSGERGTIVYLPTDAALSDCIVACADHRRPRRAEGTMKTLLFDFVFALVIIGAFATAFTIFLSP